MRRTLALLVLLAAVACRAPAPDRVPAAAPPPAVPANPLPPSPSGDLPLGEAERAFARDLLAARPLVAENEAWSPWGLYEALAMASLGARGDTAEQFRSVLHGRPVDAMRETRTRLSTLDGWTQAAQLFHRPDVRLRPAFQNALRMAFGAAARPLESVDDVNSWVLRSTRGAVPAALDGLDPEDRVLLVTAFHLDAAWETPFEAATDLPFGDRLVPTLSDQGRYLHATGDGFRVLEIPYRGGRLVFDWILPEQDLDRLQRTLTREALEGALGGLAEEFVSLRMPRFEFASRWDAAATLEAAGLEQAFTPQANLRGMAEEPLRLTRVLQWTAVRVHEGGTEAAGSTVGVSGSPAPLPFHVDRPALFLVRDRRTGVILLMGRLVNPFGEGGATLRMRRTAAR